MKARTVITAAVLLLWTVAAGAQVTAIFDIGPNCDIWQVDLNWAEPSYSDEDGLYYTHTSNRGSTIIYNAQTGADTGWVHDLSASYDWPNESTECVKIKGASTDGTWDMQAQGDGNCWIAGFHWQDYPEYPWSYEIALYGAFDDAKLYDFEFYANVPSDTYGPDNGTYPSVDTSYYTIGETTVSLAHFDNCSPSNTVSIENVAPYDYQQIVDFDEFGEPVYVARHGFNIELAEDSVLNCWSMTEHAAVPPPGDATGEGCVDGADYTVWADHYLWTGQPAYSAGGWTVGNWNEDDTVDGADYTQWADNYLSGCGAQVPEPSCAVLVALGLLALARRRKP